MVDYRGSRTNEIARIRDELAYYRQLRREYASMPREVATGTNGANQHTVRQHTLAEIQAIIKDLEKELHALQPTSGNVRIAPSRGEIF